MSTSPWETAETDASDGLAAGGQPCACGGVCVRKAARLDRVARACPSDPPTSRNNATNLHEGWQLTVPPRDAGRPADRRLVSIMADDPFDSTASGKPARARSATASTAPDLAGSSRKARRATSRALRSGSTPNSAQATSSASCVTTRNQPIGPSTCAARRPRAAWLANELPAVRHDRAPKARMPGRAEPGRRACRTNRSTPPRPVGACPPSSRCSGSGWRQDER